MVLRIGWAQPLLPGGREATAQEVMETRAMLNGFELLVKRLGAKPAAECVSLMTDLLTQAAEAWSGDIELHTTNQATAPDPVGHDHLALELRGISGGRIKWDIALYAHPHWYAEWHPVMKSTALGMSIVISQAAGHEADRLAKVGDWNAMRGQMHAGTLAGRAAELQATCRPECISVSHDGLSVTEAFHDCGGSTGATVGHNGFVMPASLADMQAGHDKVYHPDRGES